MEPHQFFKIILSPHPSILHIPDEFVMKYGADLPDVVFLGVPNGAIWEVKLLNSNGMKWLKEGWTQFMEYYSIGRGNLLLFQYNGNSHFSVFIFDLSASEIEYPSAPSEDIAPENFVNIVGDASHKKKAGRPETQNNSCDDITNDSRRKKTAKVTKVADHSYSKRQKSDSPVFLPNRVKLEKPDVEEDSSRATQEDKRKEIKEKLKPNMVKNLYCAADRGNEDCSEVLDPSASKMTNSTKCNKRKYSISLEASRSRYPLRSNQVKLEQSKENGSPSYSGKQRPSASLSSPGTQSERDKCNRVKLEKANSEEDFCCAAPKEKGEDTNMEKLVKQDRQHNLYGEVYKFKGHCNEVPVMDPSASKVTTTNQHSKKKIAISLDASNCRYPLRNKQLKEIRVEKGDVKEHCNEIPVVDPLATKMATTNGHHEKKTSTSLDMSHCRYPLRTKQLREVKLEKPITEEDLLYVTQKAKRKKPNNVKLEKGDAEECCKEIPVGDSSATKKTTTNRDNEKKTTTSLDTSHCRYLLRSKRLKLEQWGAGGNMHSKTPKYIVADSPYCKRQNSALPASSPCCQPTRAKLEKPDNLFCAAENAKGKETNNVKLETGDMEGNLNSAAYKGKDSTASELTNNWQEKGVTLREAQLRKEMYFNPYFIVSMKPAYVSRNFQLDLPDNFFNKYIKMEEPFVHLRVSDGRTWRAKLFIQSKCAKIQSSGWRDFVLGNSLKEYDTCLFELLDGIEPEIDVTIVRAPTPVP
ncbi:uncharacterized protein LOC132623866 isoform X2 [Lycium barbarum]|uniref:uncharacterized protein LOC132623866 isoform X2 n=1 Tax=Lycium barbarum TaxID=112863 RepID=UPI00293F794F|nr:uncharacterized protein LOC132623866 isoform X2 [Lycium barbarum]